MFHYPQAFLFDHSARSKPRPSLSFCPAYARGCYPHGESCALNHIDLHEISCKFDKKGCCKFGSSCYFKQSSKPIDQTSDLAPVIQKMALENSELAKRIEIAERRITVLEKELHNLNFVQSKNDSMASQTPPKTIKGVKTTKTTPTVVASAKTRGKPLVSTPSNSVLKSSTTPKLRTAKLPWIPATKSQLKAPKSRKPPHSQFEHQQLVIPTKEEKEHRCIKLSFCITFPPKNVAPTWQSP